MRPNWNLKKQPEIPIECSKGSESMFAGHAARERCTGKNGFRGRQGRVTGNEEPADQVHQPEGRYALMFILRDKAVVTQKTLRCLMPKTLPLFLLIPVISELLQALFAL